MHENQREASIEDQYRNCEKRTIKEDWTVTARYHDKAISGSTSDRPGYQAMLKAAEAKQFDVLLVDDFSRLSRDQVETEQARRRLVHWGVRLIGVSDGIDTDAKGHKMLSSFKGIINDAFLDDLRDKTSRGMTGCTMPTQVCHRGPSALLMQRLTLPRPVGLLEHHQGFSDRCGIGPHRVHSVRSFHRGRFHRLQGRIYPALSGTSPYTGTGPRASHPSARAGQGRDCEHHGGNQSRHPDREH